MRVRLILVLSLLTAYSWSSGQSVQPLSHEGTIGASVERVWAAWTTREGLQSWLAPHADIDLRVGGKMRTNYNADGRLGDSQTIENTILSYEPYRMLSVHVTKAPADFPFPNAVSDMWTVVYFEPIGEEETLVRVVSLGFTGGEESQNMRAFFDQGNALTIRQMQERIGRAER